MVTKKQTLIDFIAFVSLFLFIFGWKVSPNVDLISAWSVVLFIIYAVIMHKGIIREEAQLLLLLLGIAIYSGLVTVSHGAIEIFYFLKSIRVFLNFLGAVALVGLFKKFYKSEFVEKLLLFLFISLSLHALIMVGMYFFEPFRSIVYNVTGAIRYGFVNLNTPILSGLRVSGLTYGLAQTSVLQMFGLIIAPHVLENFKRCKIIFGICIGFIIMSILISGRTGLLLGLMLLPVIVSSIRRKGSHIIWPVLMLSCLALAVHVLSLLPDKFYKYNLKWIEIAFRGMLLGSEDGFPQTLKFFLPSDPWGLLFGYGISGRGIGGYISSDVGYILIIFGIGIIGLGVILGFHMIVFLYGLHAYRYHEGLGTMIMVLVVSVLILNAKEVALFTRNQFSVLAIVTCAAINLIKIGTCPKKFRINRLWRI